MWSAFSSASAQRNYFVTRDAAVAVVVVRVFALVFHCIWQMTIYTTHTMATAAITKLFVIAWTHQTIVFANYFSFLSQLLIIFVRFFVWGAFLLLLSLLAFNLFTISVVISIPVLFLFHSNRVCASFKLVYFNNFFLSNERSPQSARVLRRVAQKM